MATVVKDLGPVTAYGYAKDAGYTGTEEEYAELMADYASVGEAAAEAAEAAAASATDAATAQGKAETAKAAAEAAQQATESEAADAIAAIQSEGSQQVSAVGAAGTTQIGLVTEEGATQVELVEAAGEEVIESIPADYSEMTADVAALKSTVSSIIDDTLTQTGKAADAKATGDDLAKTIQWNGTALTSSTDLNDLKSKGAYRWGSTNRPVNSPTSYAAVLLVIGGSTICTQLAVNSVNIAMYRTYASSSWSEWKRIAFNSDLNDAIARISALESEVSTIIDATLTQTGKAADAKVVGDALAALVDATLTQTGKAADAKVVGDALAALVDATLTQTGKAADAKVVGDALDSLGSDVAGLQRSVDLTSGDVSGAYTIADGLYIDGGKLASISGANRTICIEAEAWKTYVIKKATATVMRAGCGSAADLAAGAKLVSNAELPTASNDALRVVTDATNHYIYIQLFANSDADALKTIEANVATLIVCEDLRAEMVQMTTDVKKAAALGADEDEIDFTYLARFTCGLSASNVWAAGTRKSYFVPIPLNAVSVEIKANLQYGSIVAFLKDDSHVTGESAHYATGAVRTYISDAYWTSGIPSDAKYLFVNELDNLGHSYFPDYVKFQIEKKPLPLGLHERPETEGHLNIVKRARQMTDIKWTPAVDLPRLMLVQRDSTVPDTAEIEYYEGTFKAGVEYTGFPYGRANSMKTAYGYDNMFMGLTVPFETFITSVSNPYSKLSLESQYSLASHRSTLYAVVCSALGSYALNVAYTETINFPSISGLKVVGTVNDNGTRLNTIKIGDILCIPNNHVAVITDIIRNADGTVRSVEISEATVKGCADRNYADGLRGGLCIRRGWPAESFYAAWGAYTDYRYLYADKVPFAENDFVNVGDGFDTFNVQQLPVMPYEGNRFAFISGKIPNSAVTLLISPNLGYGYLRVFKDGSEISGSPFTVGSDTASIAISEISVGEYSAYLCNIADGDVTNLTRSCAWSIV